MGNDTSFINSDAAFSTDGDLVALDYASALGVRLTYYASGNLVYQLYKRLSVGGEVLYGFKKVKSDDTGDDVRFQVGVVYSVFD